MLIALIGGTADADGLARRLLSAGVKVEVSTASDLQLTLPTHPNLTRHIGAMSKTEMTGWLNHIGAYALLDAAHPYAAALHETAPLAAQEAGIPYILFLRPASIDKNNGKSRKRIHYAETHQIAATLAFSFGKNVLLTTGAKNLAPYAEEAKRTGLLWAARVLDRKESIDACMAAGLPTERVIAGTGPFSVEDNLRHLQMINAGVLVTKDGGAAGGCLEKLEAAEKFGAEAVIALRPAPSGMAEAFSDMDEAVQETLRMANHT
jgi:precorrin-6A/cobalt-precorrin-6A reductase